jgi:hypothetical protein
LLVTGPFGDDAHFHATGRQQAIGLPFSKVDLTLRENAFKFPGGVAQLSFGGLKTNILSRAVLSDGSDWAEVVLGKGRILFAALPIELSGNLEAVGAVYRYALKEAGVAPVYATTVKDSGILICPTVFAKATEYVLTSETVDSEVSFTDLRSGKVLSTRLEAGRAAMVVVGTDGKLLATYHWAGK